jgi:quinol monooxygenase YgiN
MVCVRFNDAEEDAMLVCYVRSRVDEAKKDAYIESFRRCAAVSRDEDGVIVYRLAFDPDDPEVVYTIQMWTTAEAFEKHQDAPHHLQRLDDLAALGVVMEEIEIVDGGISRNDLARVSVQGHAET